VLQDECSTITAPKSLRDMVMRTSLRLLTHFSKVRGEKFCKKKVAGKKICEGDEEEDEKKK
jgi:hypothetical protein